MAIPVTDTNLYFPGGPTGGATGNGLAWSIDGGGLAASCPCPNYFKFALNVTSAGNPVTLNFPSNGAHTYIRVVVNSAPSTVYALQGLTSQQIVASAASGTNLFTIEVIGCDTNEWANAASGQPFSLTSITATGAVTIPVTNVQANLGWLVGDSRAAGYDDLGSGAAPASQWEDHSQSCGRAILNALGCEVASHVFPGIGYTVPNIGGSGSGGVPLALFVPGSDATSGWNKLWSGQARVFPANLTHVLVQNMGANDAIRGGVTAATVTASVSAFLTALRAVIPATTKVYVNPCWAGFTGAVLNFSTLTAATLLGVSNYLASSGDPLCWYIPTGLTAQELLYMNTPSANTANYYSADGFHALLFAHQLIGHRTLAAIAQAEGRFTPQIGSPFLG
jgi:hypothetical protein